MPYESKEEILRLGVIDPELEAVLKSTELPAVDFSDLHGYIENANAMQAQMDQLLGYPPASVKQSDTIYPTRDGTLLRARVYQPANPPEGGSPLIVLYHAGGFIIGSPEGEEQTCRTLVQAFDAVCISPDYRHAPKFRFPYGVKDSWDALKWAAANGKSFGADPSKGFIIGGVSSGGNITSVLSHLARDEGLSPPLTGQYLALPHVCPPSKMPEKYKDRLLSYEHNKDPILPQAALDMSNSAYQPDENDSVYYAVFNHPKGHANLPPAYFQINGLDPLRDEALIYESVLRKEYGVNTKADVYPGMPHGHWVYFPMLKQSITFRKERVEGFGWLLGKSPKDEDAQTQANPAIV